MKFIRASACNSEPGNDCGGAPHRAFHIGLRIFLLISLALTAVLANSSSVPDPAQGETPIAIEAKPIDHFDQRDPSRRIFRTLEFRGALILTSPAERFGGFSALRVQPDGTHFIALSDRSSWLRGRIAYAGTRPVGISDAFMAPVLGFTGRPENWDTESIAEDGGRLYVGLEGLNSIVRFNFGNKGMLARAQPVPGPPGIKGLPNNQGLEAMVFVPRKLPLGGTLIALSERGLNQSGNLKAFLINGPSPGAFAVKRTQDYDISDAALLPNGDLLILERKYSLFQGASMRIRVIRLKEIKPGALVDGPAVLEADRHNQIDNMEALSVHQAQSGETILTLMSDDNFSPLQRTILLQFAAVDGMLERKIGGE
jgi:hypothetical protein